MRVGQACGKSMRKEKKRKDYAFRRQFNEKPSIIPGCPTVALKTCLWLCWASKVSALCQCDLNQPHEPASWTYSGFSEPHSITWNGHKHAHPQIPVQASLVCIACSALLDALVCPSLVSLPMKVNEISKRKEYCGKVRERVQALSEACHGGQIIIDAPTFEGITNCMADLVSKVPLEPNFSAISEYVRSASLLCWSRDHAVQKSNSQQPSMLAASSLISELPFLTECTGCSILKLCSSGQQLRRITMSILQAAVCSG